MTAKDDVDVEMGDVGQSLTQIIPNQYLKSLYKGLASAI